MVDPEVQGREDPGGRSVKRRVTSNRTRPGHNPDKGFIV